MLKRLAILAGAALIVAVILVAGYYQNNDTGSQGYDIKCEQSSQPSSAAASLTCIIRSSQEANQAKSSPPWWHKFLAWPEGITAWLLMLTLGAILWQSSATAKSAEAAFLQIQMMKDKERARVEINKRGLQLEHDSEDFWNLKATIELRNVGIGRAYVRQGIGNLVITNREKYPPPEPDFWNPLDVVDDFIDPDGKPVTESFYFFPTEKLDLSEFSRKISDGRLRLYLTGFIEYETVGTRFHRDFNYVWLGQHDPHNIGAMLASPDPFEPTTDAERISFGFWTRHSSLGNDEYEIETRKNPKKRGEKAK